MKHVAALMITGVMALMLTACGQEAPKQEVKPQTTAAAQSQEQTEAAAPAAQEQSEAPAAATQDQQPAAAADQQPADNGDAASGATSQE